LSAAVIAVEHLGKIFRHNFWRRRVEAVRDVSFKVEKGAIFGFLGPNGAGKTTTIKILTGLIAASSGRTTVFDQPTVSPSVMARIGFLPENPYVYPYLTPREFLEMCGRLSGFSGASLHTRTEQVLDRVGILYAADRPVGRLSKGMLQRTCLGAALLSRPELLILDEPMSGLDPVGRMQVRDIILEERNAGRTVFFSSHILSDVESMCDQVTILRNGQVVVEGRMRDLLKSDVLGTEVVVEGQQADCDQLVSDFQGDSGVRCVPILHGLRLDVEGDARVTDVLRRALERSVRVVELTPRRETLEDLFVRRAIGPSGSPPALSAQDAIKTPDVAARS
jgi:ABC-2 type transport system ATP-binding protein